jgi:FAD/FMN-containing dehydrogenase/quercetin dioxygenase-like cupin family protein
MTSRALFPGDSGWDRARRAFNLTVDQRPAAIVFPRDEHEVIGAVRHANEHGLRIVAQATGHNAGAIASLDGTIILNLSALDGVSIDAGARRVRAGAGARWEHVVPELSRHGLAALHGSSPHVGIVGYSLGGGLGWLARKHGLQADSVTAIELVTAEGHLVRADADHEPQLFWALRGGGGSFGVVTAIEFAAHPVPELYAGVMFFALERAAEVLTAWTELLPELPDELTSWTSLIHLPDAPHLPAQVRGRSFTAVLGAYLGDEAAGSELLRPLRRMRPEIDTFATAAPSVLGELAMDPPRPVAYLSGHHLLEGLPAAGIDALVEAVGPGSGSVLTKVQLRHTGGALHHRSPGAGALATLPGSLSMFSLGLVADEGSRAAVGSSLATLQEALDPYRVGEYPSLVEHPSDAGRFFDPDTWRRLREVKALYDPTDLFQAGHHVPPAETATRSHVPSLARNGARPAAGRASEPSPRGSAVVRPVDELRWGPAVALFEGRWDGIEASVYVTTFDPGHGPRLHTHPYPEVFLVQDGLARFHAGAQQHEVPAGHFVVVAPQTPHRYENIGTGPLLVVSFQPSGVVVQTNL